MANRPKLPRTVWILGIVSLLMDLSSEIYHALLPAFLTVTLGLPVVAMGAIDGIAEGSANIAKLVSGRLSDKQPAPQAVDPAGLWPGRIFQALVPVGAGNAACAWRAGSSTELARAFGEPRATR